MRPDRDAALAELRSLAARGDVTAARVRAARPHLYRALIASCRTFGEARRLAGLGSRPIRRRWTLQLVVKELRRLHREGVRMSVPGLRAAGRADLATAAMKYAGGITRARRLAGIPEPEIPERLDEERWDAATVVAAIRRLHAAGKSIAFSRVDGKLRTAARRHCGSYRAAVEAAGFDYDDIRLMHAPHTREEVIEALRALRRASPSLTRGELGRHPLSRSIGRLFDSLDDALRAARIRDWPAVERRGGILTKADVLSRISARERHGDSLVVHAVASDDYRLYRSAIWHFGRWPLALRAAGIEGHRRVWNRDAVIDELRKRYRRGRGYTAAALKRDDNALRLAAERYFGSVRSAAAAAELPAAS